MWGFVSFVLVKVLSEPLCKQMKINSTLSVFIKPIRSWWIKIKIMKNLLTTLVALFVAVSAFAQAEKSIVIEQNSFRPVQTDALTGVNIDPIGLDYSKRPCARLKVKINRMTKTEIDGIEVKVITNNAVMKCKTAEYDNGLIIELTAKPQTRFYFHHDEFGDSNEVILNLEADKEYRLDAYLNQQYPVTIMTDVEGADVYIDDMFKGRTTSSLRLVTHDVAPGKHILRVEYSGKSNEQIVNISSDNLVFVQNLLSQQKTPTQQPAPVMAQTNKSYKVGDYYYDGVKAGVVFEVTPDGKHGKIVSMTQSKRIQWASEAAQKEYIGANSKTDGAYNMKIVTDFAGWETKYPAFKWCADLGENWYLPSSKELKELRTVHEIVNKTLANRGGIRLSDWYWSSTECTFYWVWVVKMNSRSSDAWGKDCTPHVRAVATF